METRELELVDKRAETCGQGSGDLWTREWILVDKRAEACGEIIGDLWTRSGDLSTNGWGLVDNTVM